MNRVKIYGTLGPACDDPDIMKRMLEEGMDGIRLNLSHTTLEDSASLIGSFRSAAEERGIVPELLIDMQGPELRIGRLHDPIHLKEGEVIDLSDIPFPEEIIEVLKGRPGNPYSDEIDEPGAHSVDGQQILLDDGKILLTVEHLSTDHDPDAAHLRLRVDRGGILESRKSAALPGIKINTPAMTGADHENIEAASKYGVTAVMQPFVRGKEDLIEVRRALDAAGCEEVKLLAKIENQAGVDKLEELIPYCDEIVIARGDLGNSMELWELPAVQKRIAAKCRERGRDFMVVTQMLDSMMHRQVPTRAEVSDIFNAVLDGASSVMVTGETAAGDHPVLAIRYLARTVNEADSYILEQRTTK